ncbi:hypothetical protein [uncultured Sphingomonas sp.]|uniref:hypothetical protein n=1 Tax=uncultured Sphingomonas sp. TaxID=158754 RepID=UPI0035C9A7D1
MLLKAAVALLPLSGGEVRLGDALVSELEPRARSIGYLPQDGVAYWNMLARDLVALGRLPHRSPFAAPSPEDEAAVARSLAATDTISSMRRAPPTTCSSITAASSRSACPPRRSPPT